MNFTNPTRRGLLGRLLALLFGWLWLGKNPKARARTNPDAERTAESMQVTRYSYDAAGNLTCEERLVSETHSTFDA